MFDPFKNFKPERWYQMGFVVSILLLVLTLTGVITLADPKSLALLFGGLSFFFFGEWINHPIQQSITSFSAFEKYIGTSYPWNPKPSGLMFDLIGIILICIAIYKLSF